MPVYQFRIELAECDEAELLDIAEAVYEAGCDDCTPGSFEGVVHLDFHRKNADLDQAVRSAIANVRQAGYKVARVESLTIADINAELQTTQPTS